MSRREGQEHGKQEPDPGVEEERRQAVGENQGEGAQGGHGDEEIPLRQGNIERAVEQDDRIVKERVAQPMDGVEQTFKEVLPQPAREVPPGKEIEPDSTKRIDQIISVGT